MPRLLELRENGPKRGQLRNHPRVESFQDYYLYETSEVRPKRSRGPGRNTGSSLSEDSFSLVDSPLLQLLAYQCVPTLQSIIPVPDDSLSIMDLLVPHLPLFPAPSMNDILRVEADPELEVSSLIPIHSQPEPGWGVWPDVCNDDRVSYMEQRIADNYPFEKHHWHDKVSDIAEESKLLRKMLKRKKSSSSLKRSAFNILLDRSKKRHQTHKSCQTEPNNPPPQLLIYLTRRLYRLLRKITLPSSANTRHSFTAQHLEKLLNSLHKLHPSKLHLSTLPPPFHPYTKLAFTVHPSTNHLHKPPPIHNSAVQVLSTNQNGHVCTRSVIYDASAHHTSPELHHLLFHGKEIIEKISPDFPSFTQPKYDSSTNQASRRQIFPLSPLPFTPETSPNKISDSLPGFVRHASSINAFSATATSTPLSVSNPIAPHLQDHPMEDNNIVELSDNSPARERARHMPTLEEGHLVRELRNCKSVPAPDVISPLPQIQWDLFKKIITKYKAAFHITPSKFDFSNDFLLKLAKPTQWTTTYHMEILMHMLAERHSSLLEEQKLAFVSPHLTAGLQAVSKDFNKSRKREAFKWDKQVTDLVLQPGKKWMEDVFTVYTPMIWDDQHWVGLAINLDLGCVEILDPLPDLYRDKDVDRFMAPVLKTLPFLVKKVANYQLTQFRGLEPFSWHRVSGLYINERGGDCVPVSVKFLELHAHGDPENHMSRFTDKTIDDIRRQYALDIYKTIVIPAYYAPAKS
ncbi:hypothetical protein Bca4012_065853 [Brassica carinata]